MITSGLIVTLDPDTERAAGVVRDAVLNGPFTPGDLIGRRMVLALEADTPVGPSGGTTGSPPGRGW